MIAFDFASSLASNLYKVNTKHIQQIHTEQFNECTSNINILCFRHVLELGEQPQNIIKSNATLRAYKSMFSGANLGGIN